MLVKLKLFQVHLKLFFQKNFDPTDRWLIRKKQETVTNKDIIQVHPDLRIPYFHIPIIHLQFC